LAAEKAAFILAFKWGFSDNLNCVEISESGLEMTRARNIEHLKDALLFDGCKIPYDDNHLTWYTVLMLWSMLNMKGFF